MTIEQHRDSLERLADPVYGLHEWVKKGTPESLRGFALEPPTVTWEEAFWHHDPRKGHIWGRVATVATRLDDVPVSARLLFPWLADDRATHSEYPVEGIRLGNHDGLVIGRPLVPVAQRSYRPGLHILARPSDAGKRRLLLVPDAGPYLSVKLRRDHDQLKVWMSERIPGIGGSPGVVTLLPGEIDQPSHGGHTVLPHLEAILGSREPRAAIFTPETADAVRNVIGHEGPFTEVTLAMLGRHLADSEPPAVEHELSSATERIFYIGDVYRRLTCTAWMSALATTQTTPFESAEEAARSLGSAFATSQARRLDAVLHGKAQHPALAVGDDDRSVLAHIERRRTITRYSREVPRDSSGMLWLRGIHDDHRGVLCPLQTPESTDLGFVRFAALAEQVADTPELEDYSDLSAAASLIPFINHDDPARSSIGAKNLKQAVPIAGAAAPRVRSGTEQLLAEMAGVVRCPAGLRGVVAELHDDRAIVTDRSGQRHVIAFGHAGPTGYSVVSPWRPTVEVNDRVRPGQIIAHAPDVALDDSDDPEPALAFGADVLVAYTPWFGMNHEDAIVVSEALVERFASEHSVRVQERTSPTTEAGDPSVSVGSEVSAGDELAAVHHIDKGVVRRVRSPISGVVSDIRHEVDSFTVDVRVHRPLAVGDKLTNRHGGKGVVSQILPIDQMPRLPDGRPVEMILNPVGVIRRLNVGQLIETHVSLLADLTDTPSPPVGRKLDSLTGLRAGLRAAGAPGGRLPIALADGSVLDQHGGVVVGWQYFVKLDHLASAKGRARGSGERSVRDHQPARGTRYEGGAKIGGAQRLGEMEGWALLASGCDSVLEDSLTLRSGSDDQPSPSRQVVEELLKVAMIANDGEQWWLGDPASTYPLPRDVVREIVDPNTYGLAPEDIADQADPLSSIVHGPLTSPSCVCGLVLEAAHRCGGCHTVARSRPTPERDHVRFHIPLLTNVAHPWFERPRVTFGEVPQPEACTVVRSDGAATIRTPGGDIVSLPLGDGSEPLRFAAGNHGNVFVLDSAGELIEVDLATGDTIRVWKAARPVDRAAVGVWPNGFPYVVGLFTDDDLGIAPGVSSTTPCISALPLLPPGLRAEGLDPLVNRYRRLIRLVGSVFEEPDRNSLSQIRSSVVDILGTLDDQPEAQTIAARLGHKTGLLRRSLRGRHNNWSARGVIAPDTTLGLEEVGLPEAMMDELGIPLEGDATERSVIVNRQPSLLPYSMVALTARVVEGDAIRIHPLLSKQLAGDFDGDEVTVHAVARSYARNEALDRLRPGARIRQGASGNTLHSVDQDAALGLWLATQSDSGRKLVEDTIGVECGEPLDPTTLADLLHRLADKRSADAQASADAFAKLFMLGVTQATGWSFSLVELDPVALDQIGLQPEDDEFVDKAVRLVPTGSALDEALRAGVAGKPAGIAQLLAARGQHRNFGSALLRSVTHGFLEGLDDADLFDTAPGALATLADKKLVTPRAGMLTKRLAEALFDVRIGRHDCGSAAKARTPLSCLDDETCTACYGPDPETGLLPMTGAAVGLRAALFIGESCTQRAMKTFQSGGTNDAVGAIVPVLEALLGGRKRHPTKGKKSLLELATDDPESLGKLAAEVVEALGGDLHLVHPQLALRHLARFAGSGNALAAAAKVGDPLIDATDRGKLQVLLDGLGTRCAPRSPWRERLVHGTSTAEAIR